MVGRLTPEEVGHIPSARKTQTYLGHEALRQAHLPIRDEGGLGLTSRKSIKDSAFIGCRALVLRRVTNVSTLENLPSLRERLPERSMASALLVQS